MSGGMSGGWVPVASRIDPDDLPDITDLSVWTPHANTQLNAVVVQAPTTTTHDTVLWTVLLYLRQRYNGTPQVIAPVLPGFQTPQVTVTGTQRTGRTNEQPTYQPTLSYYQGYEWTLIGSRTRISSPWRIIVQSPLYYTIQLHLIYQKE